jgi:hypothetical protein
MVELVDVSLMVFKLPATIAFCCEVEIPFVTPPSITLLAEADRKEEAPPNIPAFVELM